MDEIIRFCAVDDHDIILYGVEAMASREPDLEFRGGASSAESAPPLVEGERPDILLLDLRLGSQNSFGLCEQLMADFADLAIVMFTAFGNEDLLHGAIKAGAVGYVLKDTSTAGLPDVLRSVRRDGGHFDRRVADSALVSPIGVNAHATLNKRESAIMRLIAGGRDNYEIAEQVNLSVHMVKLHVAALLQRYSVIRRTELVRILVERQLL